MNYQFLTQTQQYKLLDHKTIKELFNAYNSGDMTAREKLILHNMGLVIYIQKKYDFQIIDDDMTQVGIIGLIKAVKAFDTTKGYQFATFAKTCIENEILMYLRTKGKYKNEISLTSERELYDGSCDTYTYEDIIESSTLTPEEVYMDDIEKNILREIISTLKQPDKQIVELFYGFNGTRYNQEQIGKITGLSQSYISRIVNHSTHKIKIKYLKLT